MKQKKYIERHIATHTDRSAEDRSAVSFLESVLNPGGRICTSFSSDDKWPNHDGFFEYVPNPDISKNPKQNFIVQIKGTHDFSEQDGVVSYCLKSLSFPAFIAKEVTADPGILFVVLNPDIRNGQRIFWKVMSKSFLNDVDFEKNSKTIKFSPEDEIKNTDESIDLFCKRLNSIIDTHLFLNKLNSDDLEQEEALCIIEYQCNEISDLIENSHNNPQNRDGASRRIVRDLYDLCYATLILNAYKNGYTNVTEQLAWEVSQLRVDTRYLCNFLRGLKYIDRRIPKEGQAERLMLKYYNYLWEIRRFMRKKYNKRILENLEMFPLDLDTADSEYYEKVAKQIENIDLTPKSVRVSRYYVQKITPFFVHGERYYEITLQLAGVYSSKYNRVTVYSKMTITTYYSIQIAYTETEINLWGIMNNIKVLNDWKVAIDPTCLNKLSKMLKKHTKINRNYREYVNLMNLLTETGINLFELINMREERFSQIYNRVFGTTNTHNFGDVLIQIRREYSNSSCKIGKNTIGYALMHMRDEVLEVLLPNEFHSKCISNELFISSRCYPFEKNPMIANLVGTKTSKKDKDSIIELLNDSKAVSLVQPYITIDNLISETGMLLFEKSEIGSNAVIESYNASLDDWEKFKGYSIIEKQGLVTIASYYDTTINILKHLLQLTHNAKSDRQKENERFIKNCGINFDDINKKIALKYIFVNSNIMLIYGAAGTGKTTLIKYISNMYGNARKLYLTKTHTALQNVIRNLDNNINNCDFEIIDRITRSNSAVIYDIVFIDECSTIDNRTMELLLGKINNNTLIVMSGDIYQIESIDFGNWFFYAKDIVNAKGASIELCSTWRTEKEELKGLWTAVREKSAIITEMLSMDGPFSENLGENIFHLDDDEVVLCLNYDGKFGLNNMNQYFQNANTNSDAFSWEEWSYKIGDRIIFTNTRRSALLYNNLKGIITNISYAKTSIIFEIEVKAFFIENQCKAETFDYLGTTENGTIIRIEVIPWDDELSEEEKVKTVIPFQLAYAISIHKAQGLEYKSVKVVIPSNNAEKITHSIFYTAITRAKEKLKIFWSAETMKSVIESFTIDETENKTLPIIRSELAQQDN